MAVAQAKDARSLGGPAVAGPVCGVG